LFLRFSIADALLEIIISARIRDELFKTLGGFLIRPSPDAGKIVTGGKRRMV
jgi:hypothetical protein